MMIANNAGLEGAVVVGKLLDHAKGDLHSSYGLNAYNGEYMDLVKGGIIDPLKVVRTALADAASVASLMITTEAMIVEEKSATPPAPQMPMGGGMGGMGGMGGGMF